MVNGQIPERQVDPLAPPTKSTTARMHNLSKISLKVGTGVRVL